MVHWLVRPYDDDDVAPYGGRRAKGRPKLQLRLG